jgi:hypothetical protein
LQDAADRLAAERGRVSAALADARQDVAAARGRATRPTGARVAWADGDVTLTHEPAPHHPPPPPPHCDALSIVVTRLETRLAGLDARLAAARARLEGEARSAALAATVGARDRAQCERRRSSSGGGKAAARGSVWPPWPPPRPLAGAGDGLPVSQVGMET